ncbi:MAG: SDR family oxidoreductase [Verrucomicrobiae bacterium]|nr:SDR family oxidoreductase [Verrucomicrobiae bacterium]
MNSSLPVALVTGANKGLGLEIVRQLAVLGVQVWIGARDERRGAEAAQRLALDGLVVEPVLLDVTRPESIAAAAATVRDRLPRLDVLVNNAGVLLDRQQPPSQTPPDLLRATLETNVIGVLQVTRAFLPLLQSTPGARVVNLSSGGGQLSDMTGSIWAPAYQISKTALNALTCLLAGELKPLDIPVNAVCPGWCRTDMGGTDAPRAPADGAETAVWLATAAPRDLTGRFFRDRQEIPW